MKYTLTVPPASGDGDDLSTTKSVSLIDSMINLETPDSPRGSPGRLSNFWEAKYHMYRTDEDERSTDSRYHDRPICKPSCIPISLILILIVLVVLLPLLDGSHDKHFGAKHKHLPPTFCNQCSLHLVESIPEGLIYPNTSLRFKSTFEAWEQLIQAAENTIELGSFYWTMRGVDVINHSSAWEGERIFNRLMTAGTDRNIQVKIAQSKASDVSPNVDTEILANQSAAEVRNVDFPRLLGGGVLHTKVWIIDRTHFYVGSANMDWRSLTQVKELGIVGYNCSCLATDVAKIFDVYWKLGENNSKIPPRWPDDLRTYINDSRPMEVKLPELETSLVYFTSSPPQLSPRGRTSDLNAIIKVIMEAEKYVHISVMDYIPMTLYTEKPEFWPNIDDALRKVAIERNVSVKLLISHWQHSRPSIDYFLRSLVTLSGALPNLNLEVRRFVVPTSADQAKIPFGRVNHNKYMVTDNTAYIGTSNWSGDYFINTAGIGVVIKDKPGESSNETIRSQLENVFERDWHSPYSIKFE